MTGPRGPTEERVRPARGLLLVRAVRTEERFPGSTIVLLESTRERLTGQQAEVLACGELEFCDDDACEREHWTNATGLRKLHPCDAVAGDWILVEPRSFVSTDTEGVWLVRQAHVVGRLSAGAEEGRSA